MPAIDVLISARCPKVHGSAEKGHVLIADDCLSALNAMGRMLEKGWNITKVHCAEEAAERIDDCTYDVLISDFDMPGHDGVWLLEQMRERFPETVRILISADEGVDFQQYLDDGLVHLFLRKPVDYEELSDFINSHPSLPQLCG